MSAITFAEAQQLTLARLKQWLQELPASERNRPRLIRYNPETQKQQAYSVQDMIVQVTRATPVGIEYVNDQAKRMNYVIQ